jgi:hypothetical protein
MSNFINNANEYLSQNDKDINDENTSPLVKAFLNKVPINHLYDCTLDATTNPSCLSVGAGVGVWAK